MMPHPGGGHRRRRGYYPDYGPGYAYGPWWGYSPYPDIPYSEVIYVVEKSKDDDTGKKKKRKKSKHGVRATQATSGFDTKAKTLLTLGGVLGLGAAAFLLLRR